MGKKVLKKQENDKEKNNIENQKKEESTTKVNKPDEEKKKDKNLLFKIIITIIVLVLVIIGGKLIFSNLKDDNSISGVRKILNTKYTDISCINSDCDGFIAIDGDKLSSYRVLLYNVNGEKVASYKVNYDASKKTTELPILVGNGYYISTTVDVDNLKVSKYSIRDKKGKVIYETENKLTLLSDDFILMEDSSSKSKYTILNKKGKEVYKNLDAVNSYKNGNYIEIESSSVYNILDFRGEKILEGYKISEIVTDDNDEDLFAIVKNVKDDVYNYYDLNKNEIIGDSFNSYIKNDDNSLYTITKKEANKRVKYTLLENGKQEKIDNEIDNTLQKIKDTVNNDKYSIYDNSVYDKNQKYIFVDNKEEKSFGLLDYTNDKYTSIYSYKQDRTHFYSTISKLDSEDETYYKITCSSYNCDNSKTIIYDIKNRKEIYKVDNGLSILSYKQYKDGYKVIKFSSTSDNKYDDKYVIFDKNNNEILISDSNVEIIDKKLIVGKKSSYSLSLYSAKKKKVLNDKVVSSITVSDETLYKYVDDNKNTVLLNSDGKEILKVNDNNYFSLSGTSYVYLDNNVLKIYNVKKDKTAKYELKENEKINTTSGDVIKPFKNVIFINNSTDKYVKLINFKGNKVKKINNAEISSVEVNSDKEKAFIIVRKNNDKKTVYGLYVAE